MRTPTREEFCHERLGETFSEKLSSYDTSRRVEVLIDQFLDEGIVRGRRALDVGCGLGFFSQGLLRRGAVVSACDLGPALVERTRKLTGCSAKVADVMELSEYYPPQTFDLLVSSECIEHTPDPPQAIRQMAIVLKPGGYLSLSTPNRLWLPVVTAATILKFRPFDGHENFLSWNGLRRCLADNHLVLKRQFGLHLFPFQVPLHGLSRWCDHHLQSLKWAMVNMCALAQKAQTPASSPQ